VRVYYEDTDAGGVVYYANYLKFFERARTEWLRSLGLNQDKLAQEERLIFVVRRALLDLRGRHAWTICSKSRLNRGSSRVSMLIWSRRRAAARRCWRRAEIRVACLNHESFKPVAIPQSLRESIQQ